MELTFKTNVQEKVQNNIQWTFAHNSYLQKKITAVFNSPDLKNPEIVTLRNLSMDSTGVYRCTASNDVGEENCTIEVKQREFGEGRADLAAFTSRQTATLIDGCCFKLQLEIIFFPSLPFHPPSHSPPVLHHYRDCTKLKLVATGHHLFTNSYVSLSR